MPRRLLLLAVVALLSATLSFAAEEGKKYALLVGVKSYDHASLGTLKHTENDAEAMAKLLKDGGFAEVVVLTTTRGTKDDKARPTAENIRKQLRRLSGLVNRHDLLLVGLAGHGLHLSVVDARTKQTQDESFFCPCDASPRRRGLMADLAKTMIPLTELFKELDSSAAGVRLLLVDACRNEPLSIRGRKEEVKILPRPSKGTAALFSCKSGERAFESDKLGHGVFFHHVIEGLKGEAKDKRGQVTWSRLVDHVIEKVGEDVPVLIGGGARQTPHEMRNIEGSSPVLMGAAKAGKVVKGDTAAERLYREGTDLYRGLTREIDEQKAYQAFRKAADVGLPVAQARVGWMLLLGKGTSKDEAGGLRQIKTALPALKKAAQAGDASAMCLLGNMYADGRGVVEDDKEAVQWFRKAADKGDPDAMTNLGMMYADGRGVVEDDREAVSWYRKAADKGDSDAMTNLGVMYANGRGVGQDDREAMNWFRKSAAKGNSAAMNNLGLMYARGRGVGKDDKEAVSWYRKSANKGNAGAMYNLGVIHEQGRGVKKILSEALSWYKKAAALGHDEAKVALKRLEKDK